MQSAVDEYHHLKNSFHSTFSVSLKPLAPAHPQRGEDRWVIVQVLGAELGDKAIYRTLGVDEVLSSGTLAAAANVAAAAGVRVPAILATGTCTVPELGVLQFVVEEHIETQTVEDRHTAPRTQAAEIKKAVERQLRASPISGAVLRTLCESKHMPCYATTRERLAAMEASIPLWDGALLSALRRFAADPAVTVVLDGAGSESVDGCSSGGGGGSDSDAVLLHQDLHFGNILISYDASSKQWHLDAVIDWESAAVADSRSLQRSEPWMSLNAFALAIKGSFLADCYAKASLPRCELGELVENADQAAKQLDANGWLPYVTWASKVAEAS